MGKRHRRQRGSGRVTPRGTRPHDREHRAGGGPKRESDLLAEVRARLRSGDPLDLLAEVSSLVSAVDPRSRSPFDRERHGAAPVSLDELVQSFGEVERGETAALLAAIAVLAPDELVRTRARRWLARRVDRLPDWLAHLGDARAGGIAAMADVLGDGEDLIVEMLLADGERPSPLSVVVYVDHNLGTVVKDAFVLHVPLDDLVRTMQEHPDATRDVSWTQPDGAEARARITEAVDHGALLFPPLESDTWPACRPIVEWAARLLPEGGVGYLRPEWDEAAKAALTEAFFGSRHAERLLDPGRRELFESILWFATDYGPGDPLRWSPTSVEILLTDWIPRKIIAPASFLSKAPDVLRAFIAYAHGERGIRPGLTAETLGAVDVFEPEYQELIRSPRPQGPAALLSAIGALDPDGAWEVFQDDEDDEDDWEPTDWWEYVLETLRSSVGGEDALRTLDDRPLPDEAFVWEGIEDDIVPMVGDVLALCDRCCNELLDVEYRTACRRFLARVAAGGPEVFRRRARPDTAAAAVCWVIGKVNDLFVHSRGGMLVKDLLAHFGLAQGSVSQRAATLIKAASDESTHPRRPWDVDLGDPGLLVSSRRRRILELRDRYESMSRDL